MTPIAQTLFNAEASIRDTEERIGDAIEEAFGEGSWEYLTWDDYDTSLEIHEAPNDMAITQAFLEKVWSWGFGCMWINHRDGSESYFHKNGPEPKPGRRSKEAPPPLTFDTPEKEIAYLRTVAEMCRESLRDVRLAQRSTLKRRGEENAALRERLAFIAERAELASTTDFFLPFKERMAALEAIAAMAREGLPVTVSLGVES